MYTVRTKNAKTPTYIRPSLNAARARTIAPAAQKLEAYLSINGWLEIRHTDTKGRSYVEFVRLADVQYDRTLALVLLRRKAKRIYRRLVPMKP